MWCRWMHQQHADTAATCMSTHTGQQIHDQTSHLRPEASPFSQIHSRADPRSGLHYEINNGPLPQGTHPTVTTHAASRAEPVSLMVLPALISDGPKSLKVSVMLDPCSTGSYVKEAAAEEHYVVNRRPLRL